MRPILLEKDLPKDEIFDLVKKTALISFISVQILFTTVAIYWELRKTESLQTLSIRRVPIYIDDNLETYF